MTLLPKTNKPMNIQQTPLIVPPCLQNEIKILYKLPNQFSVFWFASYLLYHIKNHLHFQKIFKYAIYFRFYALITTSILPSPGGATCTFSDPAKSLFFYMRTFPIILSSLILKYFAYTLDLPQWISKSIHLVVTIYCDSTIHKIKIISLVFYTSRHLSRSLLEVWFLLKKMEVSMCTLLKQPSSKRFYIYWHSFAYNSGGKKPRNYPNNNNHN